MIRLNTKDLETLSERYMFANTPTYLYTHFRNDSAVRHLSKAYSASELIDEIRQIDSTEERNLEDVVTAYALAVALTLIKPGIALDEIKALRVMNLNWVDDILKLWNDIRIPESVNSFRPKITSIGTKPKILDNFSLNQENESKFIFKAEPLINKSRKKQTSSSTNTKILFLKGQ
ncbi:MAG: hypothetical protein ACYC5A_02140 [Thermoleophilia bacterium]